VQNLMVLRFANTIFERLWDRAMSACADHGRRERGRRHARGYYDHSGAMRDMVQNHMLQVLTMLAMEPPVSLEAAAIRESKLNVLRALRPISLEDAAQLTVRARYGAGTLDGKPVPGYSKEKGWLRTRRPRPTSRSRPTSTTGDGQACHSTCATASAPQTRERHRGAVPSCAEDFVNRDAKLPPNVLMIRIQPDEGFSFDVMAKRPG